MPVPPAAGAVRVNPGPVSCAKDTNVVFAGMASLRTTLRASLGPALVRTIV